MGLSERKVKQRIGHDPRNLTWSGDTSRFSYKHMTSLGWSESRGLGSDGDGNPNHIAVVRKSDNGGIGMARAKKEGDDNAAGAGQAGRGLEDVLKRLAAASASASPSPAPESPAESSDKEQRKRNKIASRQRHLQSKRMASSSPAALAEILGVPISSLPASPSPSVPGTPVEATPEPATPTETLDPETDRTAEDTVKTSTLSVADYFKQKMREKMQARQAAAAASGRTLEELPENSLARVKETKIVASAEWEGEKMTFTEEKVDLGDLGAEAGPSTTSTTSPPEDEKATKKAKKEAKRLKKLADAASSAEALTTVDETLEGVSTSAETSEEKEKREKKERKAEKKRKREAEDGEGGAQPGSEVTNAGKRDKKEKKKSKTSSK